MEQMKDVMYPEGLPLSTMVFGGMEGQDLEHLAAFTGVYDKQRNKPMTVEMSFSDGRPGVRIGALSRYGEPEKIDFAIDGAGGERIVSVTAFRIPLEPFLGFMVKARYNTLLTN
jgi:hypothetical protein